MSDQENQQSPEPKKKKKKKVDAPPAGATSDNQNPSVDPALSSGPDSSEASPPKSEKVKPKAVLENWRRQSFGGIDYLFGNVFGEVGRDDGAAIRTMIVNIDVKAGICESPTHIYTLKNKAPDAYQKPRLKPDQQYFKS